MRPFCSASAALWCEKSVSIHVSNRAVGVQGKWGHDSKACFILPCYPDIAKGFYRCHLCQSSGFNSPSLRRVQHKFNPIPNNKIPRGSRNMLIRERVCCCMGCQHGNSQLSPSAHPNH